MPDHDETQGWIFSNEYPYWQDTRPATGARFGGEADLQDYGWAPDLYGFKADVTGLIFSPKSASWPLPQPNDVLIGDG